MHISRFGRGVLRTLCAWFAASLICADHSVAGSKTVTTLHSFCALNNCADGQVPLSSVVMDGAGNLYGTANNGGDFNNNAGTVYRLVHNDSGGWDFSVIHTFCSEDQSCPDGVVPEGKLVADMSGNLYGTTYAGGRFGRGVVFELLPNSKKTNWKLKVLYDFCTLQQCVDGRSPGFSLTYPGASSGAIYDGASPLYGQTQFGGDSNHGAL
ncbi:MAG: hypothetical protein JWO95_2887, partial [Verrucomicrobiales bacterium]|nr:hypothetical protein [Verrucomicrobiales bacterium]